MATRITLNGTVNDRNDIVHGVFEELGYYTESPIDALKKFANSCRIWSYKGFISPFCSHFGLAIEEADEVPGKFSVRSVKCLDNELKEIKITANSRGRINPDDSCEIYNPLPIDYSPVYEKPRGTRDLKEAFLERIKQFSCSQPPYSNAKTRMYWRDLDEQLVREIDARLYSVGVPEKRLNFYKYFRNIDEDRFSMDSILIEMRKEFPELTPKIEKAAYNQVAENTGLSIPIELLNLFKMPNANYEDIKKMIKPKEISH
jgi:hypothetical protein